MEDDKVYIKRYELNSFVLLKLQIVLKHK